MEAGRCWLWRYGRRKGAIEEVKGLLERRASVKMDSRGGMTVWVMRVMS